MQVTLLQNEGGELRHYAMERRGQCQEILRSFSRNNMAIYGMWGVGKMEGSIITLIF